MEEQLDSRGRRIGNRAKGKRKPVTNTGFLNKPRASSKRSFEERKAELRAKLEALEAAEREHELRDTPQFKVLSKALNGLDAALKAATELGDTSMRHAVAGSRIGLAAYMENNGWPVPKVEMPKGRVPKDIQELRSQTAQAEAKRGLADV